MAPKEVDDADILRRLVERKARALLLNVQSAGSGEIYHLILSEIERLLLQVILDETDGNQLRTADLLGINRNTLRKKIRTLGVEVRRSSKLFRNQGLIGAITNRGWTSPPLMSVTLMPVRLSAVDILLTAREKAMRPLAAVILAAGKGTRMRCKSPKVVQPVAGRPMISYALELATSLECLPRHGGARAASGPDHAPGSLPAAGKQSCK